MEITFSGFLTVLTERNEMKKYGKRNKSKTDYSEGKFGTQIKPQGSMIFHEVIFPRVLNLTVRMPTRPRRYVNVANAFNMVLIFT